VEPDPFFGRYLSLPAVDWLSDYGDQLYFAIMQFCEDFYGYAKLPSPSVFDSMMIDSHIETLQGIAGAIRTAARDAVDEIIDAEGDPKLIAEMIDALDVSMLTFATRWPEHSVRLNAIRSTMGKPKKILPSNATRPLTKGEVAQYMRYPPRKLDRRRAKEDVDERIKAGLASEPIEGSNRCIYRISDFPEENRYFVRPR